MNYPKNKYSLVIKDNKYSLVSKPKKFKNNQPQMKFPGSYKTKSLVAVSQRWSAEN